MYPVWTCVKLYHAITGLSITDLGVLRIGGKLLEGIGRPAKDLATTDLRDGQLAHPLAG